MRLFVRLSVSLGAVVALLAIAASSALGSSGPMVVTTNTTLTEDHSGSISIDADAVTLDCAGHSIVGPAAWAGIFVSGKTGVTVRNCHVSDHWVGIVFQWTVAGRVVGNTVSDNLTGILLWGDQNVVAGNVMRDNVTGLALQGASIGNRIERNTAIRNDQDGFSFTGGERCALEGNRSIGNGARGFSFSQVPAPSTDYTLTENVALGNGSDGFALFARATGHELRGNLAIGNGGSGFSFAASNTRVVRNTAFLNVEHGFAMLAGAASNRVEHNFARWNKLYDAYQQGGQSTNTWIDNLFGTTWGF